MPFKKLRLIEPLQRAVRSKGYSAPTAIQEQAFPHVVQGKDLLGCAQTGTGKTAAFAWPILQRLHLAGEGAEGAEGAGGAGGAGKRRKPIQACRPIRALILTPTRELAAQIGESFRGYGQHMDLRGTVVYGGVKQGSQCQALRRGVDILVATPGRLMDLLNQGVMTLDQVEIFVLDEADRMLDMGFIHDIRRVISYIPEKRQTLLFSATMPGEIRKLAGSLLNKPVTIKVASESAAADTVEQGVYHVDGKSKSKLLERLLCDPQMERTLVFCRTKRGADRVTKRLTAAGITADAIHSDKSQNARQRALDKFKQGRLRVLVASDIAARGIDVVQISHVVNYDMPNDAETYVHRIGRTGRAGMEGQAITFCNDDEGAGLRAIERMIRKKLTVLSCATAPRPTGRAEGAGGTGGAGGAREAGDSTRASAKPHPIHPMANKVNATNSRRDKGSAEQQKTAFWQRARRNRRRRSVGASKG